LEQVAKLDVACGELRTVTILQEKTIQELEYDRNRKEKSILVTQAGIDDANTELKNKTNTLIILDQQIFDTGKNIQGL